MVASFSRCRSVHFLLVCCHFLSADDGHERFLQCPGLQHAEDTLVDNWCTCCWRMSMTSLQSHLSFLKAFHSVRHSRIGCRSQHRGMGLLPLRMKVRRGCSPDVLSPPLHRIQCWRPCLPGQPLIRVSTDPPIPSPRGWMIRFSEQGAAHNRVLLQCLFSRRCMRSWWSRGWPLSRPVAARLSPPSLLPLLPSNINMGSPEHSSFPRQSAACLSLSLSLLLLSQSF